MADWGDEDVNAALSAVGGTPLDRSRDESMSDEKGGLDLLFGKTPESAPAAQAAAPAPSSEGATPAAAAEGAVDASGKPTPAPTPRRDWKPDTRPPPANPVHHALRIMESSDGANKAHAPTRYGTAGSSYGVLPGTFRDVVNGHSDLAQQYGSLTKLTDDQITKTLNDDDELGEKVGTRYFDDLVKQSHGNGPEQLLEARLRYYAGAPEKRGSGANLYRRMTSGEHLVGHDLQVALDVKNDQERWGTALAHAEGLKGGAPADRGAVPAGAAIVKPQPAPIPKGFELVGGGADLQPDQATFRPLTTASGAAPGAPGSIVETGSPQTQPLPYQETAEQMHARMTHTPESIGREVDISKAIPGQVQTSAGTATPREGINPEEGISAKGGAAEGGAPAGPDPNSLEARVDKVQSEILDQIHSDRDWSTAQQQKLDDLRRNVMDWKPQDFWAGKSTGYRIMAAIALGLGGYSNAINKTGNPAETMIQHLIAQDVEMQKAELGKRETVYSEAISAFGNERQAKNAALLAAIQMVRGMVAEMRAEKQGGGALKEGTANSIADIDAGIQALDDYEVALNKGYSGFFGNFIAKYVPFSTKSSVAKAAEGPTTIAVARAEHPGRAPGADYVKGVIAPSMAKVGNTPAQQKAMLNIWRERLKNEREARLARAAGGASVTPSGDKDISMPTAYDEEE